jgi:hypothetical protein
MPQITLKEVKAAVRTAEDHFEGGRISLDLLIDKDRVKLLYHVTKNFPPHLYNYGIPEMYWLDADDIRELEDWWQDRHPNSGELLRPKVSVARNLQINIQYCVDHLFNFHLCVRYTRD